MNAGFVDKLLEFHVIFVLLRWKLEGYNKIVGQFIDDGFLHELSTSIHYQENLEDSSEMSKEKNDFECFWESKYCTFLDILK